MDISDISEDFVARPCVGGQPEGSFSICRHCDEPVLVGQKLWKNCKKVHFLCGKYVDNAERQCRKETDVQSEIHGTFFGWWDNSSPKLHWMIFIYTKKM